MRQATIPHVAPESSWSSRIWTCGVQNTRMIDAFPSHASISSISIYRYVLVKHSSNFICCCLVAITCFLALIQTFPVPKRAFVLSCFLAFYVKEQRTKNQYHMPILLISSSYGKYYKRSNQQWSHPVQGLQLQPIMDPIRRPFVVDSSHPVCNQGMYWAHANLHISSYIYIYTFQESRTVHSSCSPTTWSSQIPHTLHRSKLTLGLPTNILHNCHTHIFTSVIPLLRNRQTQAISMRSPGLHRGLMQGIAR